MYGLHQGRSSGRRRHPSSGGVPTAENTTSTLSRHSASEVTKWEASGLYITTHKLLKPRLVDRYLTGIKPRYLFCIHVDTCHINPHLGKTCSPRQDRHNLFRLSLYSITIIVYSNPTAQILQDKSRNMMPEKASEPLSER